MTDAERDEADYEIARLLRKAALTSPHRALMEDASKRIEELVAQVLHYSSAYRVAFDQAVHNSERAGR